RRAYPTAAQCPAGELPADLHAARCRYERVGAGAAVGRGDERAALAGWGPKADARVARTTYLLEASEDGIRRVSGMGRGSLSASAEASADFRGAQPAVTGNPSSRGDAVSPSGGSGSSPGGRGNSFPARCPDTRRTPPASSSR